MPNFCSCHQLTECVNLYEMIVWVFQCSSLLGKEDRDEFVEEIQEDYEEIRSDHYDSLKVTFKLLNQVELCYLLY